MSPEPRRVERGDVAATLLGGVELRSERVGVGALAHEVVARLARPGACACPAICSLSNGSGELNSTIRSTHAGKRSDRSWMTGPPRSPPQSTTPSRPRWSCTSGVQVAAVRRHVVEAVGRRRCRRSRAGRGRSPRSRRRRAARCTFHQMRLVSGQPCTSTSGTPPIPSRTYACFRPRGRSGVDCEPVRVDLRRCASLRRVTRSTVRLAQGPRDGFGGGRGGVRSLPVLPVSPVEPVAVGGGRCTTGDSPVSSSFVSCSGSCLGSSLRMTTPAMPSPMPTTSSGTHGEPLDAAATFRAERHDAPDDQAQFRNHVSFPSTGVRRTVTASDSTLRPPGRHPRRACSAPARGPRVGLVVVGLRRGAPLLTVNVPQWGRAGTSSSPGTLSSPNLFDDCVGSAGRRGSRRRPFGRPQRGAPIEELGGRLDGARASMSCSAGQAPRSPTRTDGAGAAEVEVPAALAEVSSVRSTSRPTSSDHREDRSAHEQGQLRASSATARTRHRRKLTASAHVSGRWQ